MTMDHRPAHLTRRVATGLASLAMAAVLIAACSSGSDSTADSSASSGSPGSSASTTTTTTVGTRTDTTPASPTTPPATSPPTTPAPAGFVPVSASFTSPTNAWAIGHAPCGADTCSYLLRSRDGTASWGLVSTIPFAVAPARGIFHVRFSDDANGWIFGPALWATHDGGKTWKKLGDRMVYGLEALAGRATAVVANCDDHCDTAEVLSTPVANDAFTSVGTTMSSIDGGFELATTTEQVVVAAGSEIYIGPPGEGVGPIEPPCTAGLGMPSAIAAAGASTIVVACTGDHAAGSSTKVVLVSTDRGLTWAARGPAAPRDGQTNGVTIAPDQATILLSAASGTTLISRFADGAWTIPFNDPDNGGVALVDLGFTTANQAMAIEPGVGMLITRDAGTTWSRVSFG